MSTKAIPVGKRILIKKDEPKETYGGGTIYVPDSHQISEYSGVVISIGKEVSNEIKEGDHVQYADHCVPVEMDHNGEKHLIINQGDILAVLMDV
tara:strand:+ start:2529 stop:2810 length:282 start_codon:yes stop_codon:yes gene_type:complete